MQYLFNLTLDNEISSICYLAINNMGVIGWLLHSERIFNGDDIFEIFVDEEFRRLGIGSSLVKEAAKSASNTCVGVQWEGISAAFYNKVSNETPINVANAGDVLKGSQVFSYNQKL